MQIQEYTEEHKRRRLGSLRVGNSASKDIYRGNKILDDGMGKQT